MLKFSRQKLLILAIAILVISAITCITSFVVKSRFNRTAGYEYIRMFDTAQTESLSEIMAGNIQSIDRSNSGGNTALALTLSNSAGEVSTIVLTDFENGFNTIATRICKLDFCPSYGTVGFEDSVWSSATISELKTGDELVLVKKSLTGANVANTYELYISR